MNRVFVFGTLKRGFPNYEAGMRGQRFMGRFLTCEAYPLVVAGKWFSPVMIFEAGVGDRVFGEVFEVDDRTLAKLDILESTHLATGYKRLEIAVEAVETGTVFDAWVYMKDRNNLDVIHSGTFDEYQPDSRYVPAAERKSDA